MKNLVKGFSFGYTITKVKFYRNTIIKLKKYFCGRGGRRTLRNFSYMKFETAQVGKNKGIRDNYAKVHYQLITGVYYSF